MTPLHTQRDRADSFGSVARSYDRYRPRYPDDVIDDLVAAARGGRVLDVGSGTGIAAKQLADRDLDVLAVEPDPAMAAVAASKGLRVEIGTFEDWDPDGRQFDLVLFAQSWHCVNAVVAAPQAYSLLRPGGSLALLWHMTVPQSPTQAKIDALYAKYAGQPTTGGATEEAPLTETLAAAGFVVTETTYPVRTEYSTDAWLNLMSTYSARIVLEPDAARSFRADLAALVGPDGVTLVGSAYVATATKAR